jgi:hypothetical protein
MNKRSSRYPALFFSVEGKPIEVELPFPLPSDEGWRLMATLKASRMLVNLVHQVMPLLKAASLLQPDENVADLERLLADIPQEAVRAKNQFYSQRTNDQRILHDPRKIKGGMSVKGSLFFP